MSFAMFFFCCFCLLLFHSYYTFISSCHVGFVPPLPRAVAQNRKTLHNLGITHVLNAAHSKQGSIGDQSFYGDACVYLGIPAEDSDSFGLDQFFKSATDFIHRALKNKEGTKCISDKQVGSKMSKMESSSFCSAPQGKCWCTASWE